MKVKRRPGPVLSPGEAPDKDLATPIPREQRLRHRRPVQSSTYRGENDGLEAARPGGSKKRLPKPAQEVGVGYILLHPVSPAWERRAASGWARSRGVPDPQDLG